MLASDKVNTKGKLTERYLRRDVKTPLEALKQLCDKELARLKEGVSLAVLHRHWPMRKLIWPQHRKCSAPRLNCSGCLTHRERDCPKPPEVDWAQPMRALLSAAINAPEPAWVGGITHEYMCVIGAPPAA